MIWRYVVGTVMFLENARSLHLECARVLNEALFVLVLLYGSEIMILRERGGSRTRA